MSENYFPTNLTAKRSAAELQITWNDGKTCSLSFELLRAACPCASCRGGHENMSSEPVREMFLAKLGDTPATRLNRIEAVGSYALTIEWEDGHHFGIYNWHYLRALCEPEQYLQD